MQIYATDTILFRSLRPIIVKAHVKFQPNQISNLQEMMEQINIENFDVENT